MKKILLFALAACLLFTACAAWAEETDGEESTAVPVQYTEEELDPFFSGEWLEKDSQFTVVDVTKRIGEVWDVEISSPVSHGAWVIRATAAYDAVMEGLLYDNGVKYDLIPDENGAQEKETASGLWGVLRFTGTEEAPELGWLGTEELGEVYFERTELPAYRYTGEDPIEGAIAEMLAGSEHAGLYKTEPGYVTIPCPVILKTEMTDETHAKVYGDFWTLNYVKRGTVLKNISGGEEPAVILLEKTEDGWRVVSMETAGDGEDYVKDIERFADGDKELEAKYFAAADLQAEPQKEIRTRLIREYAEANSLAVTAYQDYGWEEVPIN